MREIKYKSLPAETVAALLLVSVAVDDILDTHELSPDILEELESLQPELERFTADMSRYVIAAPCPAFNALTLRKAARKIISRPSSKAPVIGKIAAIRAVKKPLTQTAGQSIA